MVAVDEMEDDGVVVLVITTAGGGIGGVGVADVTEVVPIAYEIETSVNSITQMGHRDLHLQQQTCHFLNCSCLREHLLHYLR